MQILGVSTDSQAANASFAEKNEFPYPLLCDTEKTLCVANGACAGSGAKSASRITYVIDPDGGIAQVYEKVDARKHPAELLEKL